MDLDANQTDLNKPELPFVIFSHGKESGPLGDKILALSEIAKNLGFQTMSIDYRGIDNPDERVNLLLSTATEIKKPFILVGSSMGSYVSLLASLKLPTIGLFLMAPAIGIFGYMKHEPVPCCNKVTIVHAWDDELIPADKVINYAKRNNAELHLVNSDHRLSGQIPFLTALFEIFLTTI